MKKNKKENFTSFLKTVFWVLSLGLLIFLICNIKSCDKTTVAPEEKKILSRTVNINIVAVDVTVTIDNFNEAYNLYIDDSEYEWSEEKQKKWLSEIKEKIVDNNSFFESISIELISANISYSHLMTSNKQSYGASWVTYNDNEGCVDFKIKNGLALVESNVINTHQHDKFFTGTTTAYATVFSSSPADLVHHYDSNMNKVYDSRVSLKKIITLKIEYKISEDFQYEKTNFDDLNMPADYNCLGYYSVDKID